MGFSDAPWKGAASEYPDTNAYCAACLIDENPSGQKKVQELCHLPVKDTNGNYSRNGIHNAASRLMQTKTSPANKKKAARALQSLYREMKEDVPDSVKNMAQ
jgi:hypothetical protein